MQIKLFEIRDRHTFIPAMAIQLSSRSVEESYLFSRSGFGNTKETQENYIFLFKLNSGDKISYNPCDWGNNRTMSEAHKYIIENWAALTSGEVIDVEYILGENTTQKESERIIDSAFFTLTQTPKITAKLWGWTKTKEHGWVCSGCKPNKKKTNE